MSYEWSNEVRLATLKASGADSKLLFATPIEEAEVYLRDGDIERVIHRYGGQETCVYNKDAYHIVVGEGNVQRDVYHYLRPNGPAPQMRLGITKHRGASTWSSLPHDFELNLEHGFEEVFFYLLESSKQRAIQVGEGMWYDGTMVNAPWFVRDHTFGTIPMGYHPVVGEPGVAVRYVWVYVCKYKHWEKI